MLIAFLLVGLTTLAVYFYAIFWVKPERLRKKLLLQGINGPAPSFFYGNFKDIVRIHKEIAMEKPNHDAVDRFSHDFGSYLFPHIRKWRQDYGPVFIYSMGNKLHMYMDDFNLVREFCQCKSAEFGRASFLKKHRGALVGSSILTALGASWVHQRKILAPEFFMNKVKGMVDMMTASTISVLSQWEGKISEAESAALIRVDMEFKDLAAEIISRTLFGSYYARGSEIFEKIKDLQEVLSKQVLLIGIPGLRYIPTESNREVWKLDREITSAILRLIKDYKLKAVKEEGLLQVLIDNFDPECGADVTSNKNASNLIVDNCKALFFAGHETTSNAAAFVLLLLAHHPEWQKRVRDEVEEICAGQDLNLDIIQKLKTLTMVIHETMRLYPAVPLMYRETGEKMKFGDFLIPEGVVLAVPVASLHLDTTIWGSDAGEFNPQRFANGISGACKMPYLYMPFGTGIRSCLGQNFAMIQLKIFISLTISKFTFTLSPDYRHRIEFKLTPVAQNGVHLLMKKKN